MMAISFLQDSAGDWSSTRLTYVACVILMLGIDTVLCVVALRDSTNSAGIIGALAAAQLTLAGVAGVAIAKRGE
jgi:hypothetical protein